MDSENMDKSQIFISLTNEFSRWEKWLKTLEPAKLSDPLVPSELSVKDNLAHLLAWQLLSVSRLEAALDGTKPKSVGWPPQFDSNCEADLEDINTWIFEKYKGQTWDQVWTDWHATFSKLIKVAESIPDEVLFGKENFSWMAGYSLADVLDGTIDHHQEHYTYLQAWFRENEI